jgi:rubrerythrin
MNELIRKQDALNILDEQIEQCNKALGSFDILLKDEFAIKVERVSLKAYKEQLKNLPPVQPKRKTGYKINQHQYPAKWVCSECGAKHFDFSDNFCSQCGADVRGY